MSGAGRPWHLAEALARGPLGMTRIPGSVLGPYVVEQELGRGGMGAVLRARHGPSGRAVALKVLLAGSGADDRERRRFEREAQLGAELGEGVVPVLEVGEELGLAYIAFELVEGGTLADAWEGLPPLEVVRLLLPVARTLGRLHERGVVHRDLKPANVLVRAADRTPLLADLGLGRDMNLSSSLTRTGAALGTPAYMAPEQIKGGTASPASDVFSLGVMLYEALTGEDPFEAGNIAQRYAAILSGSATPPSSRDPALPRELDAVVMRCLQTKPERRYPHAGALADDLEGFLRGALPAPPGRGRAALLAAVPLLLLLLLLLAGAGVALALRARGDARADASPAPSGGATSAASPRPSASASASALDPERVFRARLARARAARGPVARRAAAAALAAAYPAREEPRALLRRFTPWRRLPDPEPDTVGKGRPDLSTAARRAVVYGEKVPPGFSDEPAPQSPGAQSPGSKSPGAPLVLAPQQGQEGLGLWSLHVPPAGEPLRWGRKDGHGGPRLLAAAWDARHGRVVTFGGAPATTDWWSQTDGWKRFKPEETPPQRSKQALAYDAHRDVLVLCGGRGGRDYLDDLWEFDGARWRRLTPPGGPGPRAGHALVYEPARQRVLLHGGHFWGKVLGDLWSWDGERWTSLDGPGPRPRARQGAVLVPLGDGRLVLFGGGPTEDRGAEGDTWVLDRAGRWERRSPLVSPSPRRDAGAVFDPARGAVLLFGGEVWNGKGWTPSQELWEYRPDDLPPELEPAPPTPKPEPAAEVEALADLAAVREESPGPERLRAAEAWERAHPGVAEARPLLDEARPWRRAAEGEGPGARAGATPLVWHPELRGLLAFGGEANDGALRADLWLWKDGRWLSLDAPGAEAPAPRRDAAACWDPKQRRLVLWGGRGAAGDLDDLWSWDGARWSRAATPPGGPSARGGHALVWDAAGARFVLIGGTQESKVPDKPRSTRVLPLDDTWLGDGETWERGPKLAPYRVQHRAVYDPAGRRVLLFAGEQFATRLNDLLVLDATRWRELDPGPLRPGRCASVSLVATDDGRLVVFGGVDATGEPSAETWVFADGAWEQRFPLESPSPRSQAAAGWDRERKVVVVHGGLAGRKRLGDVWEYSLDGR
ncbi:MAG: kelch repeat-containing protein [Planctomycetota bacterium]